MSWEVNRRGTSWSSANIRVHRVPSWSKKKHLCWSGQSWYPPLGQAFYAWGRLRKESWVGPMTTLPWPWWWCCVGAEPWPKDSQCINLPVVKSLARNVPKWVPGQSISFSFLEMHLDVWKGSPELMREADIELYREEPRPPDWWILDISAVERVIRDSGSETWKDLPISGTGRLGHALAPPPPPREPCWLFPHSN